MISYCTIWYHIVQYDTILYNMIPYCTIWYHIVQYDTILYNMIPYSFFPWPMYKRCAAKNNHRRLENKGELPTTSKWYLKYKKCNLPIIFAGGCALQGQKSWPKCAFYWFVCKMNKNRVKYDKKPLFSPVGVPCRGKIRRGRASASMDHPWRSVFPIKHNWILTIPYLTCEHPRDSGRRLREEWGLQMCPKL